MPLATPVSLERELVDFLGDLSTLQDELLAVLSDKRKVLSSGDLSGIAALQGREETLLVRLNDMQSRRECLLARAGDEGLPQQNLQRLASSIDHVAGTELAPLISAMNARTRILRGGAFTNWLLAHRTLLHLSQLVEIIATGGRMKPTYTTGESVHARGALLDREA